MKILFFQYPSCSTCKKAAKWLNRIEAHRRNTAHCRGTNRMDNPQQFTLTKILQYERTKI